MQRMSHSRKTASFWEVSVNRQIEGTHLTETPAPMQAKAGATMAKKRDDDDKNDATNAVNVTPAQGPGNSVGRKTPRERPTKEPATTSM